MRRGAPRTGRAPQRASVARPDPAVGQSAIALRPPAYGIALADHAGPGLAPGQRPSTAPAHLPGHGGGSELPEELRARMEAAFGMDFSAVRIHQGPHVQAVGALAYTRGTDIHFAPGQYQPGTGHGVELIGHELWHVVQQSRGRVRATAQARGVNINDDAALEREADEMGARAARAAAGRDTAAPAPGALAKLAAAPDAPVQRFEAPVHEAAERQGLTADRGGAPAAGGLSNEEASAVYFGNWMRDLNQVLVPLVTSVMPPDVAFSALALMAAKKFGRAMTPEQFGYYLPAEHIDSPAGLTNQDDLLPGQPAINAPQVPGAQPRAAPYVTQQESVDPRAAAIPGASPSTLFAVDQTGTAAWIRRTNLHVERRLELAARSGRNPEGMMHFGAALHAVEDLFAHSNWIEIALGKLLADTPALLPSLQGSARQVFSYSATQEVGRDAQGQPIRRPVLMTGSFIGADTQISLTSEFTKFLSTPLSPPASAEERRVEERFMAALLRTYEAQLRNDPNFANGIRGILRDNGVPEVLIGPILNLPLAQIYEVTRLPLPAVIRDRLLNPIQAFIRTGVSFLVLQPIARRFEAEALNARVADTSLINFLREQEQRRNQTPAQLGEVERRKMELVQRFTGRTPDQQNVEAQAAAGRHAAALQATPERIVAGPSHSQLSKDHPNSPFFGLAFRVASEAVRRLRERMVAAWNAQAGAATSAFDFGWGNFPAVAGVPAAQNAQAEENRRLYHATRPQRGQHERESLERGNRIVGQGGDVHVEPGQTAPPFQPYSIAAMRRDSAERIRQTANGLRAAAGAPGLIASALQRLRQSIGLLDAQNERTRQAQETLDRSAASLRQAGQTADRAAGLNRLADQLDIYAGRVENATTIEERRAVNALLVTARNTALAELAQSPALQSGLAASILVVLDDVIAETTPAYSWEQRAVIEGARLHGHVGPAGALPTTVIDLGNPARASDPSWNGGQRPPAVVALIQESRLLLNHPYENPWWVSLVTDHVTRNQAQILADIEARNLGYSTLRRPGERRHGH